MNRSEETRCAVVVAGSDSEGISPRFLLPFLLANVLVAAAYGASFLLPQHLARSDVSTTASGATIAIGATTSVAGCLFAGRLSARFGVARVLVCAAGVAAMALSCFAAAAVVPAAAAGGALLLGLAWSVFFVLAPVCLVNRLPPEQRLRYLMLISAAQMGGLGAAPVLGHLAMRCSASLGGYFLALSLGTWLAAAILAAMKRQMPEPGASERGWPEARCLVARLRTGAALPVLMIAVAASIFATLSTFQSAYAANRGVDPDVFFVTFTVTSVLLRFTLSGILARADVCAVAVGLSTITAAALLCLLFARAPGAYFLSCIGFAAGYGLTFSTLNAMVMNAAEEVGLSLTFATQLFTLAYFVGLFAFPAVGGWILERLGVDALVLSLLAFAVLNLSLARRARAVQLARSILGDRR